MQDKLYYHSYMPSCIPYTSCCYPFAALFYIYKVTLRKEVCDAASLLHSSLSALNQVMRCWTASAGAAGSVFAMAT